GVRIVGHNNVSRDLTGVRRIELNCRGGNDHISYSLTDPGAVTNSLELSVDLGAGDDSFDATVDLPARDLAAARNFVVTGGAGKDNLTSTVRVGRVTAPLDILFDGGAGNDTLRPAFQGGVVSNVTLTARGAAGDDRLSGTLNATGNVRASATLRLNGQA